MKYIVDTVLKVSYTVVDTVLKVYIVDIVVPSMAWSHSHAHFPTSYSPTMRQGRCSTLLLSIYVSIPVAVS